MKTFLISALLLSLAGCCDAQLVNVTKLNMEGDTLPDIRHMTDMKVSGDTLSFVYESNTGFGLRFLRRAVINRAENSLNVSCDMGKRDDGYYVSYMPYPFIGDDGLIHVIGQDDCEIYDVENNTDFLRTNKYLMDGNSTVPFSLSQYVQDVFMTAHDNYVFIGREPKGGRQYAMRADLKSARIDTIRQLCITPGLQAWMPNAGEMAYSEKAGRLAFAYRLHPVIEIFGPDGSLLKSIRLGRETFDPMTLDKADFEDLNPLHTVDVSYTADYVYALNWGYGYREAETTAPTIYKIDWAGNIVERYLNIPAPLYKIAACDDSLIIGWTGRDFVTIAP